jgi:pimeloyl-ACP methyl ester carboxylesterase
MMIVLYSIMALLFLILVINFWGISIRNAGQKPIDTAELKKLNQKLATTTDNRQVAYCVYGSSDSAAPVVINMHGSSLECGFERATYEKVTAALGIRGIAISQPGCGFSDEKPGRVVKDWPREDLEAVLKAENVEKFYITGHSQGTPHAMAAAWAMPDRCLGIGLNAPLMPSALIDELGLGKTIGTGATPTSTSLKKRSMGWFFALFRIIFGHLPPSFSSSILKKGFPKVKADTDLINRFESSMTRSFVRGTSGIVWESAQDTCFDWGFDIRDIKNDNICVWHADDDSAIPANQGKWLADFWGANYKHNAEGYGHLTYCAGEYQRPEKSIIAALLKGRITD